MQSPEKERVQDSASLGLNIFMFVCWSWGTSIEVFLHKNFGSRYLGHQALAVFALVPCFGIAWERYDLMALFFFLPAYFLMLIVARIGVLYRWWRGEQCHSMYSGWPLMLKPNAPMTELKCKRIYEPFIAFVIGYIVFSFGEIPLGAYIMCGAICMGLTVNFDLLVRDMQAQRLHDAVIEQQRLAERFRELRKEY